jgi:hypothetical protein
MHFYNKKTQVVCMCIITEENLRRETPSRRITVRSSVKEILTGQLGCIIVDLRGGGGCVSRPPPPLFLQESPNL